MKPNTRFIKFFYKLPKQARANLVFNPYSENPMSLSVCMVEIYNNTKLGADILRALGFMEEAKEDRAK